MANPAATTAAALGGLLLGSLAALGLPAQADHANGYGDWKPIPNRMIGKTCDAIDGGKPRILKLGKHAMYSDVNGTRYIITMPGRICSS